MKAPHKNLSVISLIQRLYRLYRPYFGLKKNKKWRTLSAVSMVIISIILAYTMNLINVAMNGFIAVIGPSVTYGAYFGALSSFFGAILLYGAFCYVNTWIASWLAESLTYAITKKMTKKWLLTNAFIGNKLHAHELDVSTTLTHDNQHLNTKVLDLINDGLILFGNFAVGIIGLYAMSIPLSVTLFATTITIPGYLLISTICYAFIFNYINDKTGKALSKGLSERSHLDIELNNKIHHVEINAEAITFKKGRFYELKTLLETLKNNRVIKKTIIKVQSALVFLNIFNQEFSQFISFILASPSVIAGKLQIHGLFELSNHFSFIVQGFTWKSNKFEDLTKCELDLEKIETLKQQIENWEKITKKTQGNLRFSPPNKNKKFDNIEIKNLSVEIPGVKEIFRNVNMEIPNGNTTILIAPSGKGKTSLFRVLINNNIYATGEINGLPENTVFIPSEPYFPYNKTLIEALLYPGELKPTQELREKIIKLMTDFGFDASIIKLLDEVRDWKNILSDGERKRLMIINMLIKDPEVVIMDEATRGIDPATKIKVENIINQYLPKRTILFTDHNPSEKQFYHHKIEL